MFGTIKDERIAEIHDNLEWAYQQRGSIPNEYPEYQTTWAGAHATLQDPCPHTGMA